MAAPPAYTLQTPLCFLALAIIAAIAFATNPSGLPSSILLQGVMREVARKERWDQELVRVSDFDRESVVIGRSRRYEFQVRVGRKTLMVFKFPEQVRGTTSWSKPDTREGERTWWLLDNDSALWPRPILNTFDLEGPLEVKAVGDERFSLMLPKNISLTGFKRILLGEGITVKVENAQEVSLHFPSNSGRPLHRGLMTTDHDRRPYWLHNYSLCSPLPSLHVTGSASLVAYKTRNPAAYVKSAFHFPDAVELLADKCYVDAPSKPYLAFSFLSLGSKIELLERILRSVAGKQLSLFGIQRFLKVKIMPSALLKFRIQLERDISDNDNVWRRVPKWKTRPSVERVWFEVLARAEVGRGLKPLFVRKLPKPVILVDSAAWSSLLSNISFTQLQSVIVPPEAFTLDVKW